MSDHDYSATLLDAVATARADGEKIRIEGAGTKAKLGRAVEGKTLDVRNHRGVVSFEPTELVITARTGTTIAELDAALAEKGQILPFEPPIRRVCHLGRDSSGRSFRSETTLCRSRPRRCAGCSSHHRQR